MTTMTETGIDTHRAPTPAEVYDELFVPALFGPWGNVMADAAGVASGQQVLDVACGTGVAAAAAAKRVGDAAVVGLDPNPEMLDVARRNNPGIEWRTGRAETLPFADQSFDAVVSQFGFMFFEDRAAALREMIRVLRPGGRLAIAVCGAVDHTPGYAVLTELLYRLFGAVVADSMRAPFRCGDPAILRAACNEAGLDTARIERIDGTVRFDSIHSLVATERACVWTLGGLLDETQFDRFAAAAEESLRPFLTADGRIEFTMPAQIITARRH